jgi:hypothetical protein
MAVFDFITNRTDDLLEQAIEIHNQYFTIDTVSVPVLREWLDFNAYIDTYAMYKGRVHGFINIIPLTDECGEMFLQQSIREEDLRIEHFLPHDFLHEARFAYFAAIAVKEIPRYISRQCVAAMFSVAASQLRHHYKSLEKILANPTTYHGNVIVDHLGMKPLVAWRKPLGENDIYAIDMAERSSAEKLAWIEDRYAHLIGVNPWAKP